jgi:hypothetical protein
LGNVNIREGNMQLGVEIFGGVDRFSSGGNVGKLQKSSGPTV